jgi:mycofactocin biosynthesis protein MftB
VSTKAGSGGRPPGAAAARGAGDFDLDRPWQVDDRVAVRPEPFGALLYHFGTRRLSFLKNTTVLDVVRSLAEHPSARSACTAAGIGEAALPAYRRALATLAESQMIKEREVAGSARGRAGQRAGRAGGRAGRAGDGRGGIVTAGALPAGRGVSATDGAES